jgi:hypothetical protein
VPQACAGGARVWLVRRKKPYVNDTVGDWSLLGAQTALSEYLDRSSRAGVPICSLRRTRRNLTRDAGTRSSNTTKMPRALTVVEVRQMLALLSYDDLAIGRDERTSSPSCWRPDSGAHRESGCARCMRTPLLSHGIGTALITLYVVAHRGAGTQSRLPTSRTTERCCSARHFAGTNLITGIPIDIRFKGQRRPADVHAVTDQAGVVGCMR